MQKIKDPFYTYENSINHFTTGITVNQETQKLEWMLLAFSINYSQNVDLLLYKLDSSYRGNEEVLEPNTDESLEAFLKPVRDDLSESDKVYLQVHWFMDNIEPSDADVTEPVQLSSTFQRSALDDWQTNIQNEAVVLQNVGMFAYQGEPLPQMEVEFLPEEETPTVLEKTQNPERVTEPEKQESIAPVEEMKPEDTAHSATAEMTNCAFNRARRKHRRQGI